MSKYYKRDIDYIVVQRQSLQLLVVEVKKLIDKYNAKDADRMENKTVIRIEGGILREDSLGTYTQVLVESEYVERVGWL